MACVYRESGRVILKPILTGWSVLHVPWSAVSETHGSLALQDLCRVREDPSAFLKKNNLKRSSYKNKQHVAQTILRPSLLETHGPRYFGAWKQKPGLQSTKRYQLRNASLRLQAYKQAISEAQQSKLSVPIAGLQQPLTLFPCS